ncbi:MAG: molecular chaperone [Zetaproteobacteria bacterium]|nr:MAG: molecular chaperone [Zetaproteobacteria bacterium]
MAGNSDLLIRFLLSESKTRGAVIRADAIFRAAADIHGLMGTPLDLLGQTLVASILLLSISKGGTRQVLQIDGSEQGNHPIRRILAEARSGYVRGYIDWNEGITMLGKQQTHHGLDAWLGMPIKVSTVRDLGFGQPYVSIIEHDSAYLADQLVHYLQKSVQINADLVLLNQTGLLIEAMPGCKNDDWFKAVEAMARIPDRILASQQPLAILEHFSNLGCKVVGQDSYRYHCPCNADTLRAALASLDAEELEELSDEHGRIRIACQYCNREYKLSLEEPQASETHSNLG